MQELMLAADLFPSVLNGTKEITIRNGRRDIQLGPLSIRVVGSDDKATVHVTSVTYKALYNLRDDEAREDGAPTAYAMANALKRFYPDITGASEITIVRFYYNGD